jgi:galactosamine-6-phosphate isomerase
MKITYCDDYDAMSRTAADIVLAAMRRQPSLLLCPATGRSALRCYRMLADESRSDASIAADLRVVMLDEWGGLADDDAGSGAAQLQRELLDPLRIPPDRYLGFQSSAPDREAECARIRTALEQRGPIDLAVLGLGVNGHLGFIEPAPALQPHCHVADLADTTRHHGMVQDMGSVPTWGFTLGMRDILRAGRILLLISGANKEDTAAQLLAGAVSTLLPASFLWLHGHAECLIDRTAYSGS